MDSSLIEARATSPDAPKLRCLACEGYLIQRRHTGQQHVEQAWMCGSTHDECFLSGVCLPCQLLLAWFHEQDEALGHEG